MRLFTEETSWETARRDVRFTCAALGASSAHKALTPPLQKLLAQWSGLDQERLNAEDALVDANAHVHACDVELDQLVACLSTSLLHNDTKGNRRHPVFVKFFPESPTAVIRLGLESEIDRVERFFVVSREVSPSKETQRILKDIQDTCVRGRKVLAEREETTLDLARVSLKLAGWKESANAVRRSVENALDAHATHEGFARDYSTRFFPTAQRSKRAKRAPIATLPGPNGVG